MTMGGPMKRALVRLVIGCSFAVASGAFPGCSCDNSGSDDMGGGEMDLSAAGDQATPLDESVMTMFDLTAPITSTDGGCTAGGVMCTSNGECCSGLCDAMSHVC